MLSTIFGPKAHFRSSLEYHGIYSKCLWINVLKNSPDFLVRRSFKIFFLISTIFGTKVLDAISLSVHVLWSSDTIKKNILNRYVDSLN